MEKAATTAKNYEVEMLGWCAIKLWHGMIVASSLTSVTISMGITGYMLKAQLSLKVKFQ